MDVKEGIQDSNVVVGTLNINFIPTKVLTDSGATKLFIFRRFVQQFSCQICLLEHVLTVETTIQDRIPVNQICPRCEIEIVRHTFYVDLIPFELGEFGVILGMGWLPDYDARIDCKNKKVIFRVPEEVAVEFRRSKTNQEILIDYSSKKDVASGMQSLFSPCGGYKEGNP